MAKCEGLSGPISHSGLKVTRGRKLRTDGTVVETNIAYPRDSKLLNDGVRVLSRALKQAIVLVQDKVKEAKEICRNRTRSARHQARQIANYARQRGAKAKANVKGTYQRLIKTTQASDKQAQRVLSVLKGQSSRPAARIVKELETLIPRMEQAGPGTLAGRYRPDYLEGL